MFADPLRWTQCKDAAAICVVFDCSNEQSFENCAIWTDEIRSRSGRDHIRGPPPLSAPPLLLLSDRPRRVCAGALVANKTDQEDRVFGQARMRGQQFAQGYGLQYFETSAMNSDGVNDTFEAIAKDFAQSYVEYTRRV